MTVYNFERVDITATGGDGYIQASVLPKWPHDLTKPPELDDNAKEDKREPNSKPPLNDRLSNEQKLNELFERLRKNPEEVDVVADILRQRDATSSFAQAATAEPASAIHPADAPPLWADRTTGREVSPVDWIKMHYGNKVPDNWDPMGLTRADLVRLDQSLYKAYAQWIGRHEDEALRLPTKSEVLDEKAKKLGLLDLAVSDDSLKVAAALRVRAFRRK
jgi:hypothetical protein